MDIKLLSKTQNHYKFLIEGTRFDVVNGLKRSIVSFTRTLAVDSVSVFKNQSVMPDEFLAHRIGLVPMNSDETSEDYTATLYLKKKGGLVLSGDIDESSDVTVPHKNIPLVVLNPSKEVELELTLKSGTGSEHTKWSPAHVYYHGVPKVSVNGTIDKALEAKIPKEIATVKSGKIVLADEYSDTAGYLLSLDKNKINVEYSDSDFVFTIEPYGNLNIDKIITNASEELVSRLEEIKSSIAKAK